MDGFMQWPLILVSHNAAAGLHCANVSTEQDIQTMHTSTMQKTHRYTFCHTRWVFCIIASISAETDTLPAATPMMPVVQVSLMMLMQPYHG
jgi:hypothetical protein